MFINGDLVRIREEFRAPNETNRVYRVTNVNEATKRCYIELAACTLPLSPQELVSFDMIEHYSENAVKVRLAGHGTLRDADNNEYVCDADGYGNVQSSTTRELYYISRRDEHEYPVEIIPLSNFMEG